MAVIFTTTQIVALLEDERKQWLHNVPAFQALTRVRDKLVALAQEENPNTVESLKLRLLKAVLGRDTTNLNLVAIDDPTKDRMLRWVNDSTVVGGAGPSADDTDFVVQSLMLLFKQ